MNILFVCTGNTCRSPMVESFVRKIIIQNKLEGFAVRSAGLYAYEGEPASENAVEAAKKYGCDISSHRSLPIDIDLVNQSDLILTMTPAHKQVLSSVADGKVFTFGEYVGSDDDIADPFGGDLDEYIRCADTLYKFSELLVDKLKYN